MESPSQGAFSLPSETGVVCPESGKLVGVQPRLLKSKSELEQRMKISSREIFLLKVRARRIAQSSPFDDAPFGRDAEGRKHI